MNICATVSYSRYYNNRITERTGKFRSPNAVYAAKFSFLRSRMNTWQVPRKWLPTFMKVFHMPIKKPSRNTNETSHLQYEIDCHSFLCFSSTLDLVHSI
jgi:hypothetical protein